MTEVEEYEDKLRKLSVERMTIENLLDAAKKKEEVHWLNLEVDAPIYVRNCSEEPWAKRHFAKYENGLIYTFRRGKTSFTSDSVLVSWAIYSLQGKEGQEVPHDWTELLKDDPIYVRDAKEGDWLKRHFAYFSDNKIYAYDHGKTSFSSDMEDGVSWCYFSLTGEEQ